MQTLPKPPKLSSDKGGPLSSRNGSIATAVITAAIAGLLIVLYLAQYRNSVNTEGVPTPVVVAQKLIEQGASADAAATQGLFKTTEVPRDQLKPGAVTDAAALRGKVAIAEIVPGQQLTTSDFKAAAGVVTKLAADQRAITLALDSARSLATNIQAGDHVDVLAGFSVASGGEEQPVLRMLMQDVLVLAGPPVGAEGGVGGGRNNGGTEVTLRVASASADKLAFAADNGQLRLILRPQNGEKLDETELVTFASLLAGAKPVKLPRQGAR
jgi:Flp pilus assembly protein CpaB